MDSKIAKKATTKVTAKIPEVHEDSPFATPGAKTTKTVAKKINTKIWTEKVAKLKETQKEIVKSVKKRKVSSKKANLTFWEKFIKNASLAIDFSKQKYGEFAETLPGKATIWTAKLTGKAVSKTFAFAKKSPKMAWLAAVAVYAMSNFATMPSDDVGNWARFATINNTKIEQQLGQDSVIKSLAADENVFWAMDSSVSNGKSLTYTVKKLDDGSYEVRTNKPKYVGSKSLNRIAEQYKTEAGKIKIKLLSDTDYFNEVAVAASSNPKAMNEFFKSAGTPEKLYDANGKSKMVFGISEKTKDTFEKQLEELKQFEEFSYNLK